MSDELLKAIGSGISLGGDASKERKIKQAGKAAEEFESMLVKQMLGSMWQPTNGVEPSREETLYRDMLNDELSKQVAKTGELGIKRVIYEDMQRRDFGKQKGNENPDQ